MCSLSPATRADKLRGCSEALWLVANGLRQQHLEVISIGFTTRARFAALGLTLLMWLLSAIETHRSLDTVDSRTAVWRHREQKFRTARQKR